MQDAMLSWLQACQNMGRPLQNRSPSHNERRLTPRSRSGSGGCYSVICPVDAVHAPTPRKADRDSTLSSRPPDRLQPRLA